MPKVGGHVPSPVAKRSTTATDAGSFTDDARSPLEQFNALLSELGPYDICICFCILFSGVCIAWQVNSHYYTAAKSYHKCKDSSQPYGTKECPCDEYDFDTNHTSIQTEWKLVCGKKDLLALDGRLSLAGFMIACVFFGHQADQYGRRPSFLGACILMVSMGLLAGKTPWFWLFCGVRFLVGFGCGGMMIVCLVFVVEYVDVTKRELIVFMYQLPYDVGYSTLLELWYFLQEWRQLQLTTSSISLVCIAYFWVLPESPRWLVLTGYIDECATIMERSSKNRGFTHEQLREIIREAHYELKRGKLAKFGTIADLFRTPNMRRKTCILLFYWFIIGLIYGELLSLNEYRSQPRMFKWLNTLGTIISLPLIKYFSRRSMLRSTFALNAACLLTFTLLIKNNEKFKITLSIIAIVSISVQYVSLLIYTTELFPTVLRNSGLGFTFIFYGLASLLSSYITQMEDDKITWIPAVTFASLSLLCAFLVLFVPETKGKILPDTIEEGENFGKKIKPTPQETSPSPIV